MRGDQHNASKAAPSNVIKLKDNYLSSSSAYKMMPKEKNFSEPTLEE